ncbi:hypothetical protein [Microcoleus sp. bin38.metabat.b11b12b14.051]|nr:hypothetical protein [Microcoleus sp. bin38.metabat.b11b12b14.051]
MAQVDRTMQILSGGDLDAVRSNNDNTRRLKPLLYKRSPPPRTKD